jgi:hypothetical protein
MIKSMYKMHSVKPRGKPALPEERFEALPVSKDGKWRAKRPGSKTNSMVADDVVTVDSLEELERLAKLGYSVRMTGKVSGYSSILSPQGRKLEY